MHGALAVFALILALAGWTSWQRERYRASDAELINISGAQRMLSQRIALLATRPPPDQGAAMSLALERADRESLRIETILGLHAGPSRPPLPPALSAAVTEWQAARQRFLASVRALPARLGGPAREADATESTGALFAASDAMLEAAQTLVGEVQRHADAKSAAAINELLIFVASCAGLLIAVALGVVEPAARSLRRQQVGASQQSTQIERLALVAERTHNVVIITDAERRIVWANEAFARISGYTLAEALGRKPAEMLQTEATDAGTVAAMREALDAGRGMRAELLNRSKQGRDYWLDIDIQPLHDPQGTLTGFIAVETDITEQVFQRLRLRTLLDALPAGVVEQDASTGTIVAVNQAAEQVLGLSRDQLVGRVLFDERWRTVHDDLSPYPGDQHPIARSIRDGLSVRGDSMGVVTPQGDHRWLLVNSEPLRNPTGVVTGSVACFVEVTEHRAQSKLLQLAMQAADVGTWEWRLDSGEREWSEANCRMLGYSVAEFAPLLSTWQQLIHPDDRPRTEALLQQHLDEPSKPYRCEMRLRHRDGHWVWVQSFGAVVDRDLDRQARRVVGVHMDISERKRHEVALQDSAFADILTGLPNRAAVMERLQAVIQRRGSDPARHFAILFLDFDRFKQINDTLGHAGGDELLREIATRLRGTLRPGDAVGRSDDGSTQIAARLGGDEFVVLLDGLHHASDAGAVADRLLQVLARPYEVRGQRVHSTASIGVVTSDHVFDGAESLLRDADTAMYEAKQTGRGRWVLFEPHMQEKVAHRTSIEADLHEAIEQGQLFVVYQPVVALGESACERGCAGIEALVRWRRPGHGVVLPLQFITIAEECGLIGALGQFVLETACRQFMRWRLNLGDAAPGRLAVNLSVAQLRQPELVDDVLRTLQACAMPAAALQLEVTESLAAQDPIVQARLRELKSLGVGLALDDFGSGYSSLSCLHQLPVETVKIDRSFVREALRSEYHRALIDATVRVARTLRMTIVAAGVETEEQASLVASLGCDLGQGYLYSKPLEPDALETWLGARTLQRGPPPSGPATMAPAVVLS